MSFQGYFSFLACPRKETKERPPNKRPALPAGRSIRKHLHSFYALSYQARQNLPGSQRN